MLGVDDHRPCCVLQVSNALLDDAVLVMGIDAAEGVLLSFFVAGVNPASFRESSVVAVVLLHRNSILSCEGLECLFRLERLFRVRRLLEVRVRKSREMVDEDSDDLVALFGKKALELGDQSWRRGFDLIDQDALARPFDLMDVSTLLDLHLPWSSRCLAVHACGAFWDVTICKSLRKLASFRHLLDLRER